MKKILSFILLLVSAVPLRAQYDTGGYNSMSPDGTITNQRNRQGKTDSLGTDKEIPEGIHVWTVDSRFGDRTAANPDTLSHMFMNSIFTTGMRSEYNTTGNLGAPRQARIFIDRKETNNFLFVNRISPTTPAVTARTVRIISRRSLPSMPANVSASVSS